MELADLYTDKWQKCTKESFNTERSMGRVRLSMQTARSMKEPTLVTKRAEEEGRSRSMEEFLKVISGEVHHTESAKLYIRAVKLSRGSTRWEHLTG